MSGPLGRTRRRWLALAALIAVAGGVWWWSCRPPLPVLARWSSGEQVDLNVIPPGLTAGISPDGRTLLLTARGRRLIAWDLAADTRREVVLPGEASQAEYSPDGRLVAVTTNDWDTPKPSGIVVILDAADLREAARFESGTGMISHGLRFSADGRTLHALANEYFSNKSPISREVASWDVATWARLDVFPIPEPGPDGSGLFCSDGLSPDGRTLAGWSNGRPAAIAVSLYRAPDFQGQALPMPEDWIPCFPRDPTFDATGRIVAAGWQDGRVVAWDVPSGAIRRVYQGHSRRVESTDIVLSADGRRIASEGRYQVMPPLWERWASRVSPRFEPDRGETVVWDATTGAVLARLPKEHGPVLSPNGRSLATYRLDGTVTFWALPDR